MLELYSHLPWRHSLPGSLSHPTADITCLAVTLSFDINQGSQVALAIQESRCGPSGFQGSHSPRLAAAGTLTPDMVARGPGPGMAWKTSQKHAGLSDTAEPWAFGQRILEDTQSYLAKLL